VPPQQDQRQMHEVLADAGAALQQVVDGRADEGHARPVLEPVGYELAQPVFALYQGLGSDAEGLARYRKARDALRLNLTDSAGTSVSVRDLHIRPSTDGESSESGLVLEIVTDDARIWRPGS